MFTVEQILEAAVEYKMNSGLVATATKPMPLDERSIERYFGLVNLL